MRFRDKVALVTGGGSGLGRAAVGAFAAEGAAVAVVDRKGDSAVEAAAEIQGAGGRAVAIEADVGLAADATRMVAETVEAFGRLDIAVANAGIGGRGSVLDMDVAMFELVMRVNVTGVFLTGQAAARQMVAQGGGGAIVATASISGQRAGWGRVAYGTSKGGVIQLVKQMAMELAEHGIRVNAVGPGPVDTPLTRIGHSDATRAAYKTAIPLARYGMTEEMADAMLFLASEQASYITGHTLNVDGGYVAAGINA